MKFTSNAPLGNNDLEKFFGLPGCEVNIPSLMGMIQLAPTSLSETARLPMAGQFLKKWALVWEAQVH